MRYGRDKKELEFLEVDILCRNSANSNAHAKINNTSRNDKGCLSMEHKLFILFCFSFLHLCKTIVTDVTSEIVTCLTLANQIKCFTNFNRDLFLGLSWVFKPTNISI